MDIDYIRSSSYNNWDFCQMQYYLTYVLGIQKPTPKSADKGTVVHKVMESLALLNKNKKLFGKYAFSDDVCGNLEFSDDEWNKETRLSNTEVIIINNERSNPYTYKSSCKIQYPSTRVGVDVIKTLFDLSYNYYSSRSPVKWNETDRKDCWNWTWIPLEYKDGIFDPRKLNIVDAEPHFDLDVGQFSIKGTIDLVTSPNDESIEIVDWKGLPIDTKIPTPNGWSTMGDLKVGDFVFDKDGNTTKVLGKSQVKYNNCYEIILNDSSSVVCDDEHLWLLRDGSVVPITELKTEDEIDVARPPVIKVELNVNPNVYSGSYRTIKSINLLSEKRYTQCIMVDSPSSTYLCTDNMIPTHNTGQRKNWATGKRKDYSALCTDFQLMLYFYAAKRLYPQYKYFSVTIFFIRDGGPFTVSFDDEHVSVVEEKLNARYKEILNSSQPMMCDPTQNDVKCEKFCEFFKMKGDDGTNLCRFLHDKIATEGIDAVTEKYKRESHSTKNYKAPGE
jgi:hypothetical protein